MEAKDTCLKKSLLKVLLICHNILRKVNVKERELRIQGGRAAGIHAAEHQRGETLLRERPRDLYGFSFKSQPNTDQHLHTRTLPEVRKSSIENEQVNSSPKIIQGQREFTRPQVRMETLQYTGH